MTGSRPAAEVVAVFLRLWRAWLNSAWYVAGGAVVGILLGLLGYQVHDHS